MAGQGRKPEKLVTAWRILVDEVKKSPLPGNNPDAWEPLKLLTTRGPMSYGTASQCLTRLEQAGRLTKHTNGTTRLLFVRLNTLDDLGEDILGKQEEKPRLRAPSVNARRDASDEAVLLCDFQNLFRTLTHANLTLNFNDIIKAAGKYGTVSRSIAFVPPHMTEHIQTQLRIAGFRIESCPPRKFSGTDTCDQAIEEFARFCLDYTNIGTFVLMSGDGDFIDTAGAIKNSGRKGVLFHCGYNDTSKTLLSRFDEVVDIIHLARPQKTIQNQQVPDEHRPVNTAAPNRSNETAQPVGEIPFPSNNNEGTTVPADKNRYNKLLKDFQNGTVTLDKNNIRWLFLKAVVSCLNDISFPKYRKSFPELKLAVWQEIPRGLRVSLTKKDDDCHNALSALRAERVIVSMEQEKAPHTYYLLDRQHPLVASILAS